MCFRSCSALTSDTTMSRASDISRSRTLWNACSLIIVSIFFIYLPDLGLRAKTRMVLCFLPDLVGTLAAAAPERIGGALIVPRNSAWIYWLRESSTQKGVHVESSLRFILHCRPCGQAGRCPNVGRDRQVMP